MDENKARDMGHLRFGIISPLLSADDPRSLKERFAEQAEKIWTLSDGHMRQFTASAVEDWYYDYRQGGIDALINPRRRDCGSHRVIADAICQAVEKLFAEHPQLKSSNVIRLLDERGVRQDGIPSDATIYRYLRKVRPAFVKSAQERRAFEAPYAGNLYQTDIMYGPEVKIRQENGRTGKQPTYLVAIIDDHSRVICHAEFFTAQDLMVYLICLEKAFRKRGIPDKIYCDNGKVFLSEQVKRIGMEVGCRVVHTKVRDAAAKGKIERFFRTVRDGFLPIAEVNKADTLQELNRAFFKWVEEYNNRLHSSIGCSPMEKWLKSPRVPRLLSESPRTDDLFLLEVTRLVRKDGTFRLRGLRFETSYIHSGRTVTVRYDRNDLSRVHVYFEKEYLGLATLCDPEANNGLVRKGK